MVNYLSSEAEEIIRSLLGRQNERISRLELDQPHGMVTVRFEGEKAGTYRIDLLKGSAIRA